MHINQIALAIPFSGFYESVHSDAVDSEIEREFEECRLSIEESEQAYDNIDFKTICEEIAKGYAEEFLAELDLTGEFLEIVSPRFYNFNTDQIFCLVDLEDLKSLRDEIIKNNYDDFKEYIKNTCSSRSGFISFINSDLNKWGWDDERHFEILLQYICRCDSLEWEILERLAGNGVYSLIYKDEELAEKLIYSKL